jgi:hypothetical protein
MSQLPTIKRTEAKKEQPAVAPAVKPFAEVIPQATSALVEVPMLENLFEGYFSPRIDMTLDYLQRNNLRAALFGLQNRFAKLKNGKEVSNGQDALKWILENLTS